MVFWVIVVGMILGLICGSVLVVLFSMVYILFGGLDVENVVVIEYLCVLVGWLRLVNVVVVNIELGMICSLLLVLIWIVC